RRRRSMPDCPTCGVTNKEGARYCMSCGTRLVPLPEGAAAPAPARRSVRTPPPPDPIGLVGLATFLVVSAIVLILNPGVFSDIWTWFRPLAAEGRVTRPPETLIVSGIVFFGLTGLGGFVPAYLRLAVTRNKARALADGLSALGTVVFASLLVLYLERLVNGSTLLALVVGVAGVLLLTYFVVAAALGLVLTIPRLEEAKEPAKR
ncbi:MAG: zinc-ribbon domain-containing protein, partial [Methanobacteriota archaeon]